MRVSQFAHGGFQLEHSQHLPQFIVNFPGDARFFFFAHAFQVRGQLTQLFPGAGQLKLDALALADVPDDAVPDIGAVFQSAGDGLDFRPALLTLTREDSPLPRPVAVGIQRMVLGLVITGLVIRMHQAAQAFVTMRQRRR
ncbi:hypothetical protein D3C84_629550 [compost metagenome]